MLSYVSVSDFVVGAVVEEPKVYQVEVLFLESVILGSSLGVILCVKCWKWLIMDISRSHPPFYMVSFIWYLWRDDMSLTSEQ